MLKVLDSIRREQSPIIIFTLFAAFVGCSVFLDGFLAVNNLINLVRNVSVLGILGLGMSVVIIGRGIDLSLIAAMILPVGLLLVMAGEGTHPLIASVFALGLALLIGLSNGLLIAYGETPALLTTLATGIFWAGLGQLYIYEIELLNVPDQLSVLTWIGQGRFIGIPLPVYLFFIVALLFSFFMKKTTSGVFVFALGESPEAARVSGLPVRPNIVLQYCIVSVTAGLTGIILAASVNSINVRLFTSNLIYEVLLVVVIGGVKLSGGKGGVMNVVIGTLLIGLFLNALTIMDISFSVQRLATALVLLAAILFDTLSNPRDEQTGSQSDI